MCCPILARACTTNTSSKQQQSSSATNLAAWAGASVQLQTGVPAPRPLCPPTWLRSPSPRRPQALHQWAQASPGSRLAEDLRPATACLLSPTLHSMRLGPPGQQPQGLSTARAAEAAWSTWQVNVSAQCVYPSYRHGVGAGTPTKKASVITADRPVRALTDTHHLGDAAVQACYPQVQQERAPVAGCDHMLALPLKLSASACVSFDATYAKSTLLLGQLTSWTQLISWHTDLQSPSSAPLA